MNYEERYNQALEIAKHYHDRDNIHFLEHIFPELKESEDERIRKELISFFTKRDEFSKSEPFDGLSNKQIIAWIEKQGEKKHIDEFKPKFKVGDNIIKKHNSDINKFGIFTITDIKNKKYMYNNSIICDISEQNEWELVEKVDFKIGDWITFYGGNSFKILEIEPEESGVLDYLLLNQNGHDSYYNKEYVDENARLWTIQDAKDGDVLAEHETIVLFKKIEGQNIRCHCTYHYLGFNPTFCVGTLQNKNSYCPATKEQCDLLFQKMHEGGYEWDAEKKELKKIEQKSAMWSEEDEKMCQETIDWFEKKCFPYALESENPARESIKWLKSLRLQSHWKPSEEQLNALKQCIGGYYSEEADKKLESLYDDLKKL